MNFNKKILTNGLTVITSPMPDSLSVTVLVIVDTGSKYETKEQNGISHFIEHMCFKGTESRPKAIDISIELDKIGSQSNAFTGHELTGYYAKSHPKHMDKILDVVSDIYLHPVFDPKEIEKEKGVIIEEINMYEDRPTSIVRDVFAEAMYGDQPAGWKIIGPKENILKMSQKDFLEYRAQHYVASSTTVTVAGNFDEEKVIASIDKLFSGISTGNKTEKLKVSESQAKPVVRIRQKDTDQTHIIIGLRTFDAKNEKNFALKVLNAVLSGGMSSRLWQKLRDEMGVGYYVHSSAVEYTDHGYLAVACGVDSSRIQEVIVAVLTELKKFATSLVSESELSKTKEYLLGNMYLGLESSDSIAEYYAGQDVLGEEILTPLQLADKIGSVTAEEIKKLAEDIVCDNNLTMAVVSKTVNQAKLEEIFHF